MEGPSLLSPIALDGEGNANVIYWYFASALLRQVGSERDKEFFFDLVISEEMIESATKANKLT